jgi:glycosyltransferase involved in cell wall biosynthesis
MTRPIRVVHIINSFEYGGAEAMLCNLVLRHDRDRFEPFVVALIDDLTVAGPLVRAGVPLDTMGMRPGVPDPRGVVRLARHLRRVRPDVVQTWMDHSNLIGGVAARAATTAPVVWGVHHSEHVPGLTKRSTLMTVAACEALSHALPARIVCCSTHARAIYARKGFCGERLTVIPNGFDVTTFRPDPDARRAVRRELGISPTAPLIGLAARYDPVKDHRTFLRAAAALCRARRDALFLLCGAGVDRHNAELVEIIASLGLTDRCHLLGPRRDMPRVYAALDVATSSSVSEAFPLVVGEAMACGVPCVVTDVGDSGLIVGPTGRVVAPRDPAAMAAAWAALLAMPADERARLGASARQRVRERFDLTSVARRYESLYSGVCRSPVRAQSAPASIKRLPGPRAAVVMAAGARVG